jgi:hypothetical protein
MVVLEHHLLWLIAQYSDLPFTFQFADLRHLPRPPRDLTGRIRSAIDLYPCDVLFIHRDAEKMSHEIRVQEIQSALAHIQTTLPPTICVIPVRMQEAWLLFDEHAIRRAAGNPNGHQKLTLPALKKLEEVPDPKALLYELLRAASGLKGQRLARFRPEIAVHLIGEFINDFNPIKILSAFAALDASIRQMIDQQGW